MDLKHRSRGITDGRDRAPARSMFKAIGFTDADLSKPLIGVANTWIETMPCNFHLRRLSAKVKEGIRAAGGTPMEFNTIAISDGETMGTEGMRASLVSREVIADSIELVCRGQIVRRGGLRGRLRQDDSRRGHGAGAHESSRPRALRRHHRRRQLSTARTSPFRMCSKPWAPTPPERSPTQELHDLENVACPGAGACGGQYTANTMSTVMEMIGLSPMGFNSVPAMDARKDDVAFRCGEVVLNLLRNGILPRATFLPAPPLKMRSHPWLRPAVRPTPCCICWPSRAKPACRSRSTTSRPSASARRCWPILSPPENTWPPTSTKRAASRSSPSACSMPSCADGSTLTVTGRTFAEEANDAKETPGQPVIAPLDHPLKENRRARHPEGKSRARRLRGQDQRTRAPGAARPGARLRIAKKTP